MQEKTIYLSYFLSNETPLYGNGGGIEFSADKNMDAGDTCNTMQLALPNHTGTHIDVPRHFVADGKTLSDYSADFWIFNQIEVLDVSAIATDGELIEPEDLPQCDNLNADLILLKTGYSAVRGTPSYTLTPPGIAPRMADWIRAHYPHARGFGMDIISVSSYSQRAVGKLAHQAFLQSQTGVPIVLIEDMKLDFSGRLQSVIVAPLLIDQADGAPCTVIGILA